MSLPGDEAENDRILATVLFTDIGGSITANPPKKLQRSNSRRGTVSPSPQARLACQIGRPEPFESMLSNKPLTYGLGNCSGWG